MPTIRIPNSAVIRQARGFMAEANWARHADEVATVRFHESWCHMQPWVVCVLAAWALAARRVGMEIATENAAKAGYAWRLGLAEYLNVEITPVTTHDETGRFIPLTLVRNSDAIAPLIADIGPLLHLVDQPEQVKAVQYVMSEMVRNVLEHSRTPEGAVVAAQYYRGARADRSYVSLGVADCGVGVRTSLSRNYELEDDASALLTAIRPGTTGAAGRTDNAGAGLFFTRSLTSATRGYFAVGSGEAMFRTSLAVRAPTDAESVFPIARYPGTFVCVEITLNGPIDISGLLAETRASFFEQSQQTSERAGELVRFA